MDTLKYVEAYRERLDMLPSRRAHNAAAPLFSGRCVGCGEDGLLLEFPASTETPNWRHQSVDIYFKLREGKSPAVTFYRFSAVIKDMWVNEGQLFVALPLPEHLHEEQKRAFFRIEPPPSMFSALRLWPLAEIHGTSESLWHKDPGESPFCLQPGKRGNVFVLDISASGMRLRLESADGAQLAHTPDWDTVALSLAFNRVTPNQIWLKCRCQHKVLTEEGKPRLFMGLQFKEWCAIASPEQPIALKPVRDDGAVPPLLNVLLKEQLARKKSLLA